jgi:hypothetical protein
MLKTAIWPAPAAETRELPPRWITMLLGFAGVANGEPGTAVASPVDVSSEYGHRSGPAAHQRELPAGSIATDEDRFRSPPPSVR